ncbi:MAG TPA: isocitrate lyase/PEP mutase family protein [Candidatus Sulfotelmatobacter sp.]|nr:isocitrate lyase/PEP mutase family protein [Candidatus Sulfotelmatobacter sp.]
MTSPNFADRRARLRARIADRAFVSAPGVFDLISARIADEMDFAALYMTGYGTVASHLGLPDAGLATYSDMVGRVAQICRITRTPLIADADTGYGGLLNVQHTVQGYEEAGAAAIQIEDQEFPKKCGHTPGRRVIPTDLMVRKIQVAVEARRDPNFLIVARTDARTSRGLDEAIARGKAYEEAGADVLFIESPESENEMARIGRSFTKPLLANMVDGGKTPVLSRERLQALGYAIAIFPGTGFLAAGAALRAVYGTIRETGSSAGVTTPLYDFAGFNKLMGFEAVWAFDRAHAED